MTTHHPWQARHTRLVLVLAVTAGIALAVGLTLMGLSQNVTYFYTPSDVMAAQDSLLHEHKVIRIGGLVEKGSIQHAPDDALSITFTVTDLKETLPVRYKGIVPDLFRDGQGVVAQGRLTAPFEFTADTLLAKHDEKYMPPEVAKALKKNMDKSEKAP